MPRPPRFMVLEDHKPSDPGADGGIVPRNGLAFPVICKPVEACGKPVALSFGCDLIRKKVLLLRKRNRSPTKKDEVSEETAGALQMRVGIDKSAELLYIYQSNQPLTDRSATQRWLCM